jgi:hypothetical protein
MKTGKRKTSSLRNYIFVGFKTRSIYLPEKNKRESHILVREVKNSVPGFSCTPVPRQVSVQEMNVIGN